MNAPRAAAWDYFVEESVDYTGNGCASTDLNWVTPYLVELIEDDGAVGDYFSEVSAFPQDWWESCSSTYETPGSTMEGLDDYYADNRGLAVFAGHGFKGNLHFGRKKHNMCLVDLGTNARLGSMGGNDAAVAMYISSCTLHTSSLVADANFQWLRQQLGYHNSPQVASGDPGLFYVYTGAPYFYSNSYAWNLVMEEDISGDDENSPIVVSYGTTLSDAESVRDTAKVRSSVYMTSRSGAPACEAGQPSFHFLYVMTNNGDC
jgi:hypothetical protein